MHLLKRSNVCTRRVKNEQSSARFVSQTPETDFFQSFAVHCLSWPRKRYFCRTRHFRRPKVLASWYNCLAGVLKFHKSPVIKTLMTFFVTPKLVAATNGKTRNSRDSRVLEACIQPSGCFSSWNSLLNSLWKKSSCNIWQGIVW